ncbi:hypothetical protein IscW_ISCW022576 [Ixodes scapularis]|uniref:Uncharacterized protein n=1 Tax=Ixodes scapularis TaxID=6945 RepID=B7QBA7_IXOSC|nr:hypothetical protein IscW_ISCW022576 [Ixodes scapularis]|eukprot:XP_002412833.1 hypothetical protein IscW_ISCW022576 [Ixodes scapularis]
MDFRRKEVDGLPCLLVARMAGSGDRRTDCRRRGHNDGDPAPASPRGTSRNDPEHIRRTWDAFPNGPRMGSEKRIRCRESASELSMNACPTGAFTSSLVFCSGFPPAGNVRNV